MFAGGFAMIFGIVYLRTRENMAMIEKGMNPKRYANLPAPFRSLKFGLLLAGAGIGLLLALATKHPLSKNWWLKTGNGRQNMPNYWKYISSCLRLNWNNLPCASPKM